MTNWEKNFERDAVQLGGADFARQWRERGVTARDAARWANLGYTPGEAHASGMTLGEAVKRDRDATRRR